jgi:hypothetical protein
MLNGGWEIVTLAAVVLTGGQLHAAKLNAVARLLKSNNVRKAPLARLSTGS